MKDHIQAILTGKDLEKFEDLMQHYTNQAGVELSRSQVVKTLIREKWLQLRVDELAK